MYTFCYTQYVLAYKEITFCYWYLQNQYESNILYIPQVVNISKNIYLYLLTVNVKLCKCFTKMRYMCDNDASGWVLCKCYSTYIFMGVDVRLGVLCTKRFKTFIKIVFTLKIYFSNSFFFFILHTYTNNSRWKTQFLLAVWQVRWYYAVNTRLPINILYTKIYYISYYFLYLLLLSTIKNEWTLFTFFTLFLFYLDIF